MAKGRPLTNRGLFDFGPQSVLTGSGCILTDSRLVIMGNCRKDHKILILQNETKDMKQKWTSGT